MEEINIEIEQTEYEQLLALAQKEGTTIEEMVIRILKLCVKENGLVVWKDGFDKPYTVLKTKEEIDEWMQFTK